MIIGENKDYPLHSWIRSGRLDLIKGFYSDQPEDVDPIYFEHRGLIGLLHEALDYKKYEIFVYLIDMGASCEDIFPQIIANGDHRFIEEALKHDINIRGENEDDYPLFIAAERGDIKTCMWLIKLGADYNRIFQDDVPESTQQYFHRMRKLSVLVNHLNT